MFDNETANNFVNQVVLTIDGIFKDKQVSQDLLDYLYLVAAGMIINYGTIYIGDIYKIFSDVTFVRGKKDVYMHLDPRLREQLDYEFATRQRSYAFTAFQIEQNGFVGFLPTFNIKYILYVTDQPHSNIMLLEFLAHELNHILMSTRKTFSYENGSIYVRNGLFKAKISGDSRPIGDGRAINEVVNTLQTEDVIKAVLSLSAYDIKNEKFKRALSYFKGIDYHTYQATGYEILVNMFRGLYEEEQIKSLFFRNVIEGNVPTIHDYFDKVLGNGSFDDMSKKLDELYKKYTSFEIGRSISEFEFSSEMVSIRDSFVKKFYDKKFGYRDEKKVSM